MCPNFRPLQLPLTLVLILSLASLAFATDKKRKAEENTKDKAKTAQKSDPKQLAKAAKEKDSKNKQQLAKNKKFQDEDEKNKRNKRLSKAEVNAAKQHEEKSKQQKDKVEKVKDKKDKTAKRESERDKKKQELAVKKTSATKDKLAKSFVKSEVKSENKSERKASPDKHEAKVKVEKERKSANEIAKEANATKLLAKAQLKATFPAKTNYQAKALAEEKIKELPSAKFTLRPIAKIIPKVELKFSIAKALAANSFDPPPPRETGPDIIEVIEENSLEARKLDELYRQEVKALQFSNIPNVSNKRMDLKKMDAERISQIQEALARKGYYLGATTGIYDDQTLSAMRKFQEDHKIDVTGYATAHTLKLLGLTDWERHYE